MSYKARVKETKIDGIDTLVGFYIDIDGKTEQQDGTDGVKEDRLFWLQICDCHCPIKAKESLKKFLENYKTRKEAALKAPKTIPLVEDVEA